MTAETELDRSLSVAIESDGFAIIPRALPDELVDELRSAVASVESGPGVYDRDGVYAIRDLFARAPSTRRALAAPAIREIVGSVLGPDAFCVRGLFLDKTPRANWKVPWHQDATVTVRERAEVTGFGPWSTKAGVQHVMAPPGLLAAMLTLRLYLDDCAEEGGALKLLPTSHQYGRLPQDSIEQFTREDATSHNVSAGDVLVMRPLTLHASRRATEPGSRRVIQLEFAARSLPKPLEWREAHQLS